MERLTHEADFGLEDWEETLFFVKSDPNGAYNILDIAKYQGYNEFDEILKIIALRLASIENILGDDYDLRLCNMATKETREVVQKMCDLAEMATPEYKGLLVPMCVYHGGKCHEMNGGCKHQTKEVENKNEIQNTTGPKG